MSIGGLGPQKTAAAALAPFFKVSGRTLEKLRLRSNFELTRVGTFSEFIPTKPDDWDTFDAAVRTLSTAFAAITNSEWPELSASSYPHGWGRVRAEMGTVMKRLGWRLNKSPSKETPGWQSPAAYAADQAAIELLRRWLRPFLP